MTQLILHRVTFTGADDSTSPAALATIAIKHPWIEFAALVSPSQQGSGRYPSRTWREEFYDSAVPVSQRALHLCGRAVDQFIAGSDEQRREIERVGRVQLNFRIDQMAEAALRALPRIVKNWQMIHPQIEFIFQWNGANAALPAAFAGDGSPTNVSFLRDASGGRGIAPSMWPPPLANFTTAYAGGIGPGHIRATLSALAQVTACCGIDMETSVRTDDRFDLYKVRSVIDEALSCCDVIAGPKGVAVLALRG